MLLAVHFANWPRNARCPSMPVRWEQHVLAPLPTWASAHTHKCSIWWILGYWNVFPVEIPRECKSVRKNKPSLACGTSTCWGGCVAVGRSRAMLQASSQLPSAQPRPQCGGGSPGPPCRRRCLGCGTLRCRACFGLGVPASNQSSFMLSLQARAQTFNHSS